MHGKTGTPRQASTGGYARHVETTQRAAPPVHGDLRTDEPSAAVRIPPFAVAQDNSWARQWPLQSSLELGAFPGAVPCARLHTRQMLWEWRLTGLRRHRRIADFGAGNERGTDITRGYANHTGTAMGAGRRTRVLILVWDSSPLPPARMRTSEDDENGRGLLLVETLSTRWDWYFPPQQNGGKVVCTAARALPPTTGGRGPRPSAVPCLAARRAHRHCSSSGSGRTRSGRMSLLGDGAGSDSGPPGRGILRLGRISPTSSSVRSSICRATSSPSVVKKLSGSLIAAYVSAAIAPSAAGPSPVPVHAASFPAAVAVALDGGAQR